MEGREVNVTFSNVLFQSIVKKIYSKRLQLSVAIHQSSVDILLRQSSQCKLISQCPNRNKTQRTPTPPPPPRLEGELDR